MASRRSLVAAALALLPLVHAQNPGAADAGNPKLTTYKCTTAGGCVKQDTSVVIDWNYHWIHTANGYDSCTTSSGVDSSLCPDAATCARNCVIEPANYTSAGVATSGDTLTMHQYIKSDGEYVNASPRLYLLGSDGDYVMMKLLGQELTFEVDLSTLPCGENGALYLSEMSATGGRNEYNKGGAEYGSGYCDAQCPVQTWKNGTLNTNGSGFCCNEMDILEGNSRANSFTPHPCSSTDCDKGGCGFNPYALGQQNYWGPGGTVDTFKPFTVTTQFITSDGTQTGTLKEIRRQYIQNGKEWCTSGASFGGLTTMGQALGRGMVLAFSIWNDNSQFMNWLDSGSNGPCSSTEGNPDLIKAQNPTTHVVFSNIRWGDIGSTFSNPGGSSSSSTTRIVTITKPTTVFPTSTKTTTIQAPTTTTTASGATQTQWGQCGGQGWSSPTACATPYTCQAQNAWYSQCV
ncbi:putative endoglucanase [Aspergillus clavatus NRRL 1]|uniref:Glucanase n=1 Tax=Aspergillus clavatus (strain ATCC 1007 / CBS 513.65 / DSM 816 / NCTC 3887 / NRRL 1 / QM 1276 / 107) TaxID=344612 RepID=A1CN15_ASPCL|nr:endoglucanase, putative [Aspergillus clavatus NRRL 1]EAW08952.1 endoglucanase, putative [Aspergillus clavatus NRRL 1]